MSLRSGWAAVLVSALLVVPAPTTPIVQSSCGCPSHISDGTIACHRIAGTHCSSCTYKCENYQPEVWCVCELLQGCGTCGGEPCEEPPCDCAATAHE